MSVELLANPRVKTDRGTSLESRVSALENYVTLLLGSIDIADGAITTSKILNGAVEELKIASGAVTAAKTAVAGLNSSTGDVSANHIIAGMIQSGAITTSKIYAGAVTSDEMTVSFLSAISTNIGSVTAGTITGVTIKTASSGARVQLDSSSYIQAYDSSGLRMKLDTNTLHFYDSNQVESGYIYANAGVNVWAGNDLNLNFSRIFNNGRFLGANIELSGYLDLSGNISFLSTQYIKWGISSQYYFRHDGSDFAFNDGIVAAGSIKNTVGSFDQQSTVGRVRQYLCGLRSRTEPGNPASGEVYIYYNSSNNNLEVKFSDGALFILANN